MTPLTALVVDWVMTACWPLIGSLGMAHYSGILFSYGGLVLGGALLAPFVSADQRRLLVKRRVAPTLAAMGFFSGLATVIFISALEFTSAANAAIMAQVEVLYSAALCAYFLGENVSKTQAAASLLIIAGTGLIVFDDLTTPRWKGDVMILATPWMFQVSHMLSKRLPRELDPVAMAAGRVFYGVLTLTPFAAWSWLRGGQWSWEPRALALLGAQGVLMSCLNFVLWYQAIRGMDLAKATAIMLSYPALTVFFSWALGHEAIAPVQIAGLAVTLAGAYWVSKLVLQAQKGAPALPPQTPGRDLVP